jgi:high-affinity iron transporter
MFLDAVILILQEILEAALLIGVLLVLMRRLGVPALWPGLRLRGTWVAWSLGCGALGAWLYAGWMPVIAEWFDYVGQDVVNALIQAGIVLLMLVFGALYPAGRAQSPRLGTFASACLVGMVALVVAREGSEIILYMSGVMGQPENLSTVLLAAMMAAGIGLSCGVFLHYGLVCLRPRQSLRTALLLLALFMGSMASQAVLLLTQADWVPWTDQAWDSSSLIDEAGITGQLLYALVGYEATPSLAQAGFYSVVIIAVMLTALFRKGWNADDTPDGA